MIPSFGSGAQLLGTGPLIEAMQRRGMDTSPLQMQSIGSAGFNPFTAPQAPIQGGAPMMPENAPTAPTMPPQAPQAPMPTPVPTPQVPGVQPQTPEAQIILEALSTRLKNISDMEKKQFEATNPPQMGA